MFDLERAKRESCLTRDGRKVRIIGERSCSGRGGDIVALVAFPDGEEVATFCRTGENTWVYRDYTARAGRLDYDLVNLPLEKTWFVTSDGRLFESEAAAICKVREYRQRGHAAGYAPVTITINH